MLTLQTNGANVILSAGNEATEKMEGNLTMLKYQEEFVAQLVKEWMNGDHAGVRTKIRNLKNKAQAAYIAASISAVLMHSFSKGIALEFVNFMHPNN